MTETPITEYLISKELAKNKKGADKIMAEIFPNRFYGYDGYGKSRFAIRPKMYCYFIIGIV